MNDQDLARIDQLAQKYPRIPRRLIFLWVALFGALVLSCAHGAPEPRWPTVDLDGAQCVRTGRQEERLPCNPSMEGVDFLCVNYVLAWPRQCFHVTVRRWQSDEFAAAHPVTRATPSYGAPDGLPALSPMEYCR